MTNLSRAMNEVTEKGYWVCDCGNNVEPDGECYCGIKNPLIEQGLI